MGHRVINQRGKFSARIRSMDSFYTLPAARAREILSEVMNNASDRVAMNLVTPRGAPPRRSRQCEKRSRAQRREAPNEMDTK